MIESMLSNVLFMLIYSVLTAISLMSMWSLKRVNPVFWFIVFQWIFAIGTFAVADITQQSDFLYCGLYFIALIAFVIGSQITMISVGIRNKYRVFFSSFVEEDRRTTQYLVFVVVLLSAAISLFYYYSIGYNLFADVLFGTEIEDFKSARLATYSGETYYAPGYVNQFKNILLPIGLYVICLWLWFSKRYLLSFGFTCFAIALSLYVLLGTGQRAPFIYSFAAFLFGLATVSKFRLPWLIIASVSLVALFGLFSVLNGRADALDPLSMLWSFLVRIFLNDQQEGLWGFRHILELDTSWFSDWGLGVLGVLPNHSGSPLDHELYYLLHGTTRGTSSLSTVGSVFHNGGFLSVPLFYLMLGSIYSLVYNSLLSGRRTVLRGMSYGGLIFILSVFVSGSPIVLINKGLLAFLLLLLIRKTQLR